MNYEYDENKMILVDIVSLMKESYLDYSMSVITARALPDVRDGLKYVQRRILYSMYEDKLFPSKSYLKSATTVGNVLGRYHPHGSDAVYDALVRLAQDFSLRYPLIDGHGNFGSIDGDPPAAYRYTEARMSEVGLSMLADIEKAVIDYQRNFDNSLDEPTVLPAPFPNLLVNGSDGIAVGMATHIPPHNMKDVIDATIGLIQNKDMDIIQIIKIIKAPDFPQGGIIVGGRGLEEAYLTGRGRFIVRAKTEIIEQNKENHIIVTEIPYKVNKSYLIEAIAELAKEKKIIGIAGVDDHSDRNGMMIDIRIKKGFDPNKILRQLFRDTQLQITFSAIFLVIDDGVPKVLNIKQIIERFISFRLEIIARKAKFDLEYYKSQCHIIDGLLIAVNDIDRVIEIMKSSHDIPTAKRNLIDEYSISDVQAQYICDMRLGRLNSFDINKLIEDKKELDNKIAENQKILNDDTALRELCISELIQIRDKFADDRRTKIINISERVNVNDVIENEAQNYVFALHDGRVFRMHYSETDISLSEFKKNELSCFSIFSNYDFIYLFTNKGNVCCVPVFDLPKYEDHLSNKLEFQNDEYVVAILKKREYENSDAILFNTKCGFTKRVSVDAFNCVRNHVIRAISLDMGDELVSAIYVKSRDNVVVCTEKGSAICYTLEDIRTMGRLAKGVKSITLSNDDNVIGAVSVDDEGELLIISKKGYAKCVSFDDFSIQLRGGKGVICYKICDQTGLVSCVLNICGNGNAVVFASTDGRFVRYDHSTIPRQNRYGIGTKITDLSNIVSASQIANNNLM